MAYILVVDDQRVMRHLLYRALSSMGHEATIACSGKEVLTLCREHQYDLVILDYRMPDMDGLEIARCLGKELRFILHTSDSGDNDIISEAFKMGALGVIPKITSIRAFIESVEKFLSE